MDQIGAGLQLLYCVISIVAANWRFFLLFGGSVSLCIAFLVQFIARRRERTIRT